MRRLVPGLSTLAALGALTALVPGCSPHPPSDASRASVIYDKAPDFKVELLSGETFHLADHLGKDVIVLDFWTTFCQPCIGSLRGLNEMYKKHKGEGLVVIAVSMDQPETAGNITPFVQSHGLTLPVAYDSTSRIADLYNKKSTAPFQVLIGRDGRILKQREAYQPGDDPAVERDIEMALSQKLASASSKAPMLGRVHPSHGRVLFSPPAFWVGSGPRARPRHAGQRRRPRCAVADHRDQHPQLPHR